MLIYVGQFLEPQDFSVERSSVEESVGPRLVQRSKGRFLDIVFLSSPPQGNHFADQFVRWAVSRP